MMLTHSHVSILLSTGIVLFFTAALFLSGYAIQQRTLRELRAAIRPKPRESPKIFLPDRFKATTTELDDGTVVVLESEAEREAREMESLRTGVVVEVKPTTPEEVALRELWAKNGGMEGQVILQGGDGRRVVKKEEEMTERERTIRDFAQRNQKNPDPDARGAKMLSRAERRRMIKEEIQRLAGEGSEKTWYQRRLY